MTVHIGWVIAAALAGFLFGALIMSLAVVASRRMRGGKGVT